MTVNNPCIAEPKQVEKSKRDLLVWFIFCELTHVKLTWQTTAVSIGEMKVKTMDPGEWTHVAGADDPTR